MPAPWSSECGHCVSVAAPGWKSSNTAPNSPTSKILPRRWVVERTFDWLGRSRRLSKDYEHSVESSESFIDLAMLRIMLGRLAK
jgi:transposase